MKRNYSVFSPPPPSLSQSRPFSSSSSGVVTPPTPSSRYTRPRHLSDPNTSLPSYNSSTFESQNLDFLPKAVDTLVNNLGLTKGSKVIDLAAGSGTFTKTIVGRGYDLVAVDPSSSMIEAFYQTFPDDEEFEAATMDFLERRASLPISNSSYTYEDHRSNNGLRKNSIWETTANKKLFQDMAKSYVNPPILKASSYNLPFADNSIDSIIIADAFHWFADHQSLKEMCRVLKNDGHYKGSLGLIWNYENIGILPADNWQVKTTKYIWSFSDGSIPHYNSNSWRIVFENQLHFQMPLNEQHFVYEIAISKSEVWNYWKSKSVFISQLPRHTQDEIKNFIDNILASENIQPSDMTPDGKLIVRRGVHIVWTKKS